MIPEKWMPLECLRCTAALPRPGTVFCNDCHGAVLDEYDKLKQDEWLTHVAHETALEKLREYQVVRGIPCFPMRFWR